MTAPVAFRLLNASECRRLADRLEAALGGWRADWLPPGGGLGGVEVGDAARRLDWQSEADWMAFPVGDDAVYLAGGGAVRRLVRRAIAGPAEGSAAPDESSVAAGLLGAALTDLVDRLAGGSAGAGAIQAPPRAVWRRGSGAAGFSLPLPGGAINGVFDAGQVRRLLQADGVPGLTRRPVRPLANPRAGIGSLPVEIKVWLGSAELALPAFQTLAVDDVLVLDARIDEPLRVSIAGQLATPRAILGSVESRKAVRLSVPSSTR